MYLSLFIIQILPFTAILSEKVLSRLWDRVAQSVGYLTRKSWVLGSIPGLAIYFRFSFRFFQEGQLSGTGESMCTKYWLTA